MMSRPDQRLEVIHFQRKKRDSGNFSLEFIFADVRARLNQQVNFKVIYAKHYSNGLTKRFLNIIQAYRNYGPVNHVTGDIHYVNFLIPKRTSILTILDCGAMHQEKSLKRFLFHWIWLKIPVWKSTFVTAISEATKQDIIKYTDCHPDKVIVIPVAVSEQFVPAPKAFNSEYPVLLQIGTAYNKNIERLIPAIEGMPCKLTIIGKLSDAQKQLLDHHQIDYANRFNLTDEEIYTEYKNCDLVTFTSTFEGFGMPIVEANCVERPVIAGNNSSMPEVGKNAAHYVDATSVEDIRSGIRELIQNRDLREELISNGRINRERYSNQKIADMYLSLYEQINERNRN